MASRIFRNIRLVRTRRLAENDVDGAPTNLLPGEACFDATAEKLYVAKDDGSLVEFAAGGSAPVVVPLAYAATLNTDASLGDIFDVTLTGNVTIAAPTNATNGQTLRWRITQDGTGGRTVALDAAFKIPSSASSPLPWSTAADTLDILAATYDATADVWDVSAFVYGYPR